MSTPTPHASPQTGDRLLDVQDLQTYFYSEEGVGKSVDGVSFHIARGEVLGMVGESGCGKSVTSLSIMRLVPQPPGKILGGKIMFEGQDLLGLTEDEMRKVRGNRIAMIFQEPMTSLNPVFTVSDQIMEGYVHHRGVSSAEGRARALDLMKLVGIPAAEKRLDDYPHQFSGGMRQRIMMAMALACDPRLVIADEPTTALDVTIQAQILDLMNRLRSELGMSILLITHDLSVIAETAHRVVVMYAGKIIEESTVGDLFDRPLHPYTRGLLGSIPRLDKKTERLTSIDGVVPSPYTFGEGCRFYNRCKDRMDKCQSKTPLLTDLASPGQARHAVACFLHSEATAS